MLVRLLEKSAERFDGLLKRFGELALLLVAPVLFQSTHLGVKTGNQALKIIIKTVEILGEPTEFGRVDIGFGHGAGLLNAQTHDRTDGL